MITKEICIEKTVLDWPIRAVASSSGEDWQISVLGGCRHHVGSVSLCTMEHGELVLKSFVVGNHKDGAVSDLFAEKMCRAFGTTVAAACGIHYDDLTKEGLKQVMDTVHEMADEMVAQCRLSQGDRD